jgi:hypothetical protein
MDEDEDDQMEDASGHLIGIVSPREKRRIQLVSMKQSKLRKR